MGISRITQVRLRNWKNFKDVDVRLGERVFLIGPNASGKSNFLDVFRFLNKLATSGLREAVSARDGVSAIRCLAATRYSDIAVDVVMADETGTPAWQYRLVFNQDKASRAVIKEELVEDLRSEKPVLTRPQKPEDIEDPLRLTQTALEQIVANRDFREIADFFESVSYQHLLPQVVRDPKGFSPSPIANDPFGRDFLLRLRHTPEKTRNSRLEKLTRALQVAVPQLEDLRSTMDPEGVPHLVGRCRHWRPHGAKQYENQFSDGTLRLFGLMWSVFEGSGPLLVEEPELSLHADVVRQLPTLFEQILKVRGTRRRQVLLSTHSESLLENPSIGPNEVLWFEPSQQGTIVHSPDDRDRALWDAGLTAADILLPKSGPKHPEQLGLPL